MYKQYRVFLVYIACAYIDVIHMSAKTITVKKKIISVLFLHISGISLAVPRVIEDVRCSLDESEKE